MAQNPQQLSYEQWLSTLTPKWEQDKTFTDKMLGRQDTDRLITLIQKDELSREDFSEILNIISGINSKLVNYNDFDRYLLGKYYTWIRSFIKMCMGIIGLQEKITGQKQSVEKYLDSTDNIPDAIRDKLVQDVETYVKDIDDLEKARNIGADDSKFLLDVFLFLSNSTLSLNAAAFDTLTSSRFEYAYSGGLPSLPGGGFEPQQKQSIFSFWRRGK